MRILAFYIFLLSVIVTSVTYGFLAAAFKWFPYHTYSAILSDLREQMLNEAHPSYLFETLHSESSVVTHKPDKVGDGLVLISGYMPVERDWVPGIKLIDNEGNTVFNWTTTNLDLFRSHMRTQAYVHGSYVYPNGDILLNFEYRALVKLSACGEILWRLEPPTHHSLFRDEEGNFWASGLKRIKGDAVKQYKIDFPGIAKPYVDETIVKISPEGEILKEISLLKAFYSNEKYRPLLWKYKRTQTHQGDIFHMNDAEVLNPSLADKFPGLEPWDVVVSLKKLNTIAILNQDGEIKWLSEGDFNEQHDPDFEPDGRLVIFNNNMDFSKNGEYLGGSKIQAIAYDDSYAMEQLYPVAGSPRFYTKAGGKHQLTLNGNRMITEAQTGRAIEVTPEGEIVWEWINDRYDDVLTPEVLEVTRYENITADVVKSWSCDS